MIAPGAHAIPNYAHDEPAPLAEQFELISVNRRWAPGAGTPRRRAGRDAETTQGRRAVQLRLKLRLEQKSGRKL